MAVSKRLRARALEAGSDIMWEAGRKAGYEAGYEGGFNDGQTFQMSMVDHIAEHIDSGWKARTPDPDNLLWIGGSNGA